MKKTKNLHTAFYKVFVLPSLITTAVLALTYWPIWYAQKSLGFIPAAVAHSTDDYLTFNPKIPDTTLHFQPATQDTNYKAVRAKEICQMAKDAGIGDYCTQLISQLLRECGSMTEFCGWKPGSASNDHGYAIGLAQWHLFYRYHDWFVQNHFVYPRLNPSYVAAVRDKFFHDYPQMRDWRYQAQKYVAEMSGCVADRHTIWQCIDTWNANPNYVNQVKGQLANAKQLLSPL